MKDILKVLEIDELSLGAFDGSWLRSSDGAEFSSDSPGNGSTIGRVRAADMAGYESVVSAASETFYRFREHPAPLRGEIVRQLAEEFRRLKEPLSRLITLEMGKIYAEAEGEVQEVIDIADFAVGLSRQLYGKTMHSERPGHRMYEQWHPFGNVGVITAFNFPAAVWAWNAMIAAVCGNSVVWKPSEVTPLTAIAITKLAHRVTKEHGFPGLFTMFVSDGPELGQRMAADRRFPLVSATGSCRMGKSVGETVGKRLGRSLLELGGNNAVIVLDDADLDLAVRAVFFGAVGTSGQRCTTTRRVFLQRGIEKQFTERLIAAYRQVRIGDPLKADTLMGPVVNAQAVEIFNTTVERAKQAGAELLCGGKVLPDFPSPLYVEPTILKAEKTLELLQEENFAPIVYLIGIENLDEAIALQNDVPQGLSSAIFTKSLQRAEQFLSARGSDCGIANVNLGTSGAEIGGAFGGEKETGGGREAGSDSWKAYMRRQTSTINWTDELPLAQGISFGE